tara:strand:+ start:1121 stop:1708 length:588 start_codon:yes stop_codon:yes gene_type:complete
MEKLKLTKKQKEILKKNEEEANNAKAKSYELTQKAIKDGKVVTIDPEKTIWIPVMGEFRDYLSETLNHLFTTESEEASMQALNHIKEGFKNVPKDDDGKAMYNPYMNACWTLITLISEINNQASLQGHTIITDENVDESMSNFLGSFIMGDESDTKETLKETQENYKQKLNKVISDDNKESAYDSEKKGQTSSED